MTTNQIIKELDWDCIFGNTSQYENLYDFLSNSISLEEFYNGFYPKSRNKKIIKNNLTIYKTKSFKKHAKKLWNKAKIGEFK